MSHTGIDPELAKKLWPQDKTLNSQEVKEVFSTYVNSEEVYYRNYTYCTTEADVEKENSKPLNYLNKLSHTTFTTISMGHITSRGVQCMKLLLKPLSKLKPEHCDVLKEKYLKLYQLNNVDVYPVIIQLMYINVPMGNDLLKNQFTALELVSLHEQLRKWGYGVGHFFGPDHWANWKTPFDLGIALDITEIPQPLKDILC